MKKLPFLFGLALVGIALGGCELYLGKEKPSDNPPGSRPPGDTCASNADCAPGCFCDVPAGGANAESGGACQEAGFCDKDAQCAAGFHCDDRKSCVPNPQCAVAADCAADGSATCDNGACEATSCVAPAPGTCTVTPAACNEGQVATVYKGCFTGGCTDITACNDGPSCSLLVHEADCLRFNTQCSSIYNGINCTGPGGGQCQAGQPNCTCEQFKFASCQDHGTSGRMLQTESGLVPMPTSLSN